MQQWITNILTFNEAQPLIFTQGEFWLFLMVVLCFFSIIHQRVAARNAFLFGVSIFFYYKTSGIFTLALLSAIVVSYLFGLLLSRSSSVFLKRLWLTLGILYSLSLLCYFKYAYFFADVFSQLSGSEFTIVEQILLPVGISFYTFQCISYLMDIYRQKIDALRSILDYGFYVSFFPQLVAGPIVRASDFVYQLHRPFSLSRRWFGIAVFWILNGLIKKIILSDYIAVNFIDRVFANPTLYDGFENLLALFGYSLQVYADFSGYTDIAIGVALMMGFYLPKNFDAPYKATNAPNFWKRWHISLSRWLQDYLYIPMGGNRNASFATYAVIIGMGIVAMLLTHNVWVAIILMFIAMLCAISMLLRPDWKKKITTNINATNTMLIGGLWHGASWNFVIWGGLNGLGMIVYKLWHPMGRWSRVLVISLLASLSYYASIAAPHPLWNIAYVWLGVIMLGTLISTLWRSLGGAEVAWSRRAWNIAQTFVFITFTRLFFRAGSNLDPELANEQAWETATSMIEQIGGQWRIQLIPAILTQHIGIVYLIIMGMIIHWIDDRTKRRYRIVFASLPLWLMAIICVVIVLILYQFVTTDMQKFIYFQF
ncbi:MAG: MBOAT family O-acyltransferase [Bacteroidia bacterium]|nr:MBOAT family O-acyltransferase [Bacteroidia bacterium]